MISAVIVTKGDCDLSEILKWLPYDDKVIWDNSKVVDAKLFGRYLGMGLAKHPVIYTQDDDVIIKNQRKLMAAYQPGIIVTNMEKGRDDYDWIGWGSIFDKHLPWRAFARYAEAYGLDELFYRLPDLIFTCLTPVVRVDYGVDWRPNALGDDRMYKMPDHEQVKAEIRKRCEKIKAG